MAIKGSKARGIGDCALPMAESKQGNAGGSPGASRLHAASRNALLQLVCTLLWLSVEEVRPLSVCSPPPLLGFILLFSFPLAFFLPSNPLFFPEGDRRVSKLACPRTLCASQGRRRPIPEVHFLPVPRAPGVLSHTCVSDPAPTPPTSHHVP